MKLEDKQKGIAKVKKHAQRNPQNKTWEGFPAAGFKGGVWSCVRYGAVRWGKVRFGMAGVAR